MTSEGLGKMFEGEFADKCGDFFLLVSMGGWAEGLACADPGARPPSALAEIYASLGQFISQQKLTGSSKKHLQIAALWTCNPRDMWVKSQRNRWQINDYWDIFTHRQKHAVWCWVEGDIWEKTILRSIPFKLKSHQIFILQFNSNTINVDL